MVQPARQDAQRRVLVVGLGRFGAAVADTLWHAGAEVLVVDLSADAVDTAKDHASAAFVGDGTEPKVLEGIGAREVDTAVVTFAEHFEPAVLCVASLARLGVKEIVARAATERQADILRAVGATSVLQLEAEGGRRLGAELSMQVARDLVDLASEYRVVPWTVQGTIAGRTLASAQLRQRYGLNVLGIRPAAQVAAGGATKATNLEAPAPESILAAGDTLLLVGEAHAIARFRAEEGGG